MFAVPEVDDDADVSASVETKHPIAQPEVTKETLPSPPSQTSSIEKVEKQSNKMQAPPPQSPSISEPIPAKQHRSRRSLFHRNTIHICDQIVDRV
jgi:hypothetical protein